MTKAFWAALALATTLAGCGAGDPPSAPGGIDLRPIWRSQL